MKYKTYEEERGREMKNRNPVMILLSWLLLSYMLIVFGPMEIFFGNATQFDFIFSDFAGWLFLLCVVTTAIGTGITLLLPKKVGEVITAIIFGCALAGYLQVMFINKGLDLLGLNPDGCSFKASKAIPNLCIWVAIILILIVLSFWKNEIWKKLVTYLSGLLLAMQIVAMVSLIATGGEAAYSRGDEDWHFTGAEQYTVSGKDNVIVLVLDYFSNAYIPEELAQYPDALDFLHDFTYYNNADCTYFGTFPSLNHMLTGYEMDPTIPINQWFKDSWTNEKTKSFYEDLQKKDYKVNVYTEDSQMLRGTNEVAMLSESISNVQNMTMYVEVDTKLLLKTMTKMSCYRLTPYVVKHFFYTDVGEYTDIVKDKDSWIRHQNYDFKDGLEEKKITVDDASNYFIVQHLMGIHQYNNTADCEESEEGTTREETIKGCLTVTDMYLEELKAAGVYDNATIIITADHGGFEPPYCQPILFVKRPGEQHEVSIETDAPVSHKDLMATIAEAAGIKKDTYGASFFDYQAGEQREREFWLRVFDENYPAKPCYCEEKDGADNVYKGYIYTGNNETLSQKVTQEPDEIIEEIETFY